MLLSSWYFIKSSFAGALNSSTCSSCISGTYSSGTGQITCCPHALGIASIALFLFHTQIHYFIFYIFCKKNRIASILNLLIRITFQPGISNSSSCIFCQLGTYSSGVGCSRSVLPVNSSNLGILSDSPTNRVQGWQVLSTAVIVLREHTRAYRVPAQSVLWFMLPCFLKYLFMYKFISSIRWRFYHQFLCYLIHWTILKGNISKFFKSWWAWGFSSGITSCTLCSSGTYSFSTGFWTFCKDKSWSC